MDDHRNDHGLSAVGLRDPPSDTSSNYLLESMGITNTLSASLQQRLFNLRLHGVKDVIFFGKGSRSDFRSSSYESSVGIHHHEHLDKALFGQNSAIVQIFLGYSSNGFAIDVQQSTLNLANYLGFAVG